MIETFPNIPHISLEDQRIQYLNSNNNNYNQNFIQDNNNQNQRLYQNIQPIILNENNLNNLVDYDYQSLINNNISSDLNNSYFQNNNDFNYFQNVDYPLNISHLNNENQKYLNKAFNYDNAYHLTNSSGVDYNVLYNSVPLFNDNNYFYCLNHNNQINLKLFPKIDHLTSLKKYKKINNQQKFKKIEDKFLKNIFKGSKKSSLKKSKNKLDKKSKMRNFYNSIRASKLKLLNEDFSPDFWQNFYHKDDPFFNYEKNNNDKKFKTRLTTNQENSNILETYIGEVNKKGEKHGFGKLIRENVTKIGTWRHNKFTGWGREIWKEGKIYEGKFINGKICGKGIYKDDYMLYIGDFFNSIKNGKGELFTNDYHYIGNIIDDNFEGEGRIDIYNEGSYEGNFDKGKINGFGTFKWLNGDYYEGEMKNGLMHGYGKLSSIDGNVYEGFFKNGKMHGKGTLRNKEGNEFKGKFINGIPINN